MALRLRVLVARPSQPQRAASYSASSETCQVSAIERLDKVEMLCATSAVPAKHCLGLGSQQNSISRGVAAVIFKGELLFQAAVQNFQNLTPKLRQRLALWGLFGGFGDPLVTAQEELSNGAGRLQVSSLHAARFAWIH